MASVMLATFSCTSPSTYRKQTGRRFIRRSAFSLLWRRCLTSDGSKTRPAQTGGVVFDSSHTLIVTTSEGMVFRLDVSRGRTLWSRTLHDSFATTATVHGSKVFVPSVGGRVYAMSRYDGSPVWKSPPALDAGVSTPAVYYDTGLYVLTDGDVLHVLDSATGRETAQYRVMLPMTERTTLGHSGLLIHEGRLFFGTEGGYVAAFRLGEPNSAMWATRIAPRSLRHGEYAVLDSDVTPFVHGGTVYGASQDGGLALLDPDTGVIVRQVIFEGTSAWTHDAKDDALFIYSSERGLMRMTMGLEMVWNVPLEAGAVRDMKYDGRTLFLLSSQWGLVAVDPSSGKVWNTFSGGLGASGSMALGTGRLAMLDDSGCVDMFEIW